MTRQEVKERIAGILYEVASHTPFEVIEKHDLYYFTSYISQILSLPEIAVLDEKQELPEQDILGIVIASHIPAGMKVKLIDDVIKSHGWKKCIKQGC